MNEQELRNRLHSLGSSIAPAENPMPTLHHRRRKKRTSAGIVLAVVAVVALASGRQSLENLLGDETGVELPIASAPLRSGEMLPAQVGKLDLTDQQTGATDVGGQVSQSFAVVATDLVRIAVRCETPNSSARVLARAPGYLDQQLFTPCSRSGDALDIPLKKLWKLPGNRTTGVVLEITLTSTYGGGTPFVPDSEVLVGHYQAPAGS
jgi:hypothetical protein